MDENRRAEKGTSSGRVLCIVNTELTGFAMTGRRSGWALSMLNSDVNCMKYMRSFVLVITPKSQLFITNNSVGILIG
jgi:hypothetical protein